MRDVVWHEIKTNICQTVKVLFLQSQQLYFKQQFTNFNLLPNVAAQQHTQSKCGYERHKRVTAQKKVISDKWNRSSYLRICTKPVHSASRPQFCHMTGIK